MHLQPSLNHLHCNDGTQWLPRSRPRTNAFWEPSFHLGSFGIYLSPKFHSLGHAGGKWLKKEKGLQQNPDPGKRPHCLPFLPWGFRLSRLLLSRAGQLSAVGPSWAQEETSSILASMHSMPIAAPPQCDAPKCFQILPNVLWGRKYPT